MISRRAAWFLVLAGVFNIVIWPRFGMAVWDDERAWEGAVGDSTPTGFLWVHAVLIVVAVSIAVGILWVAFTALRSRRKARSAV
ncbi:hypothetical protein KV102_05940 [Mumia sp. zg.B53]|uniref:SCO4848 family membrane protein n=1 Tax=unclassified Mumia TaxID=2621872 RepID=UPI001C6DD63F|nr:MULTISPECIES: hypothetical protein [unclassified Mumia]MBW9207877.1 hypothetical protein [Mumia sp. zg.B17]MBW9209777.1 hypothetical protein [Mumia sp. zg.B21]MBW9214380.1 hypothetical protein [Mumia sp. zg.B53]MDD9347464.1 hypothetical protein [Mumia sp.]